MRVTVLGAGITGVTTAYYLARQGHAVTVFERDSEVAGGASGDNGGQLSYSFTDAMANPRFLLNLPRFLASRDPAVMLRPGLRSGLLRWGLAFLRQCSSSKSRENTLALLELARQSAGLLRELREEVPVDFSYRPAGKLVLLSTDRQVRSAEAATKLKRAAGSKLEIVSFEQACKIEPALSGFSKHYRSAIWSPSVTMSPAWMVSRYVGI